MALVLELLSNIILLVTRPFALLKLSCVFIIRTAFIVIYTWTELVRATIRLHLNLIWGIVTWTIGIISLPARVVNALYRERQVSFQFVGCPIITCHVAFYIQILTKINTRFYQMSVSLVF